jgi:hypothetical protein
MQTEIPLVSSNSSSYMYGGNTVMAKVAKFESSIPVVGEVYVIKV